MSYETPKELIEALGGYRQVAHRLGQKPTTLHTHIRAGKLPSRLYRAVCALAVEAKLERPSMSLFSFAQLRPEGISNEEDAA
jgi:IS30 family transposase